MKKYFFSQTAAFLVAVCFFSAFTFSISGSAEDDDAIFDPMEHEDPTRENLFEKTNAELFVAERDLRARIAKNPKNADLYYEIAMVCVTLFDRTRLKKGRQSREWLLKSRNALEKVLMLRPDDKVAHYNLGIVYKRLIMMELSREEFRKSVRLADEKNDAMLLYACWFQIGLVYEEQGFWFDARQAFLKAKGYVGNNADIEEAVKRVSEKSKMSESEFQPSALTSPGGDKRTGARYTDPKMAAVMGEDPTQVESTNISEAIPVLGQMLANAFGKGDDE